VHKHDSSMSEIVIALLFLILGASSLVHHGLSDLLHLKDRINNITGRPTWLHRYTFPPLVLRRANTVSGDDHRMERFMKNVIRGNTWMCAAPNPDHVPKGARSSAHYGHDSNMQVST
jgi:hypothetical protein